MIPKSRELPTGSVALGAFNKACRYLGSVRSSSFNAPLPPLLLLVRSGWLTSHGDPVDVRHLDHTRKVTELRNARDVGNVSIYHHLHDTIYAQTDTVKELITTTSCSKPSKSYTK